MASTKLKILESPPEADLPRHDIDRVNTVPFRCGVNGHLRHTPFSPLKRGDGGVYPSDTVAGLHTTTLLQRSQIKPLAFFPCQKYN